MTMLDGTAITEIERLALAGDTIIQPPANETRNLYYLRRPDGGLDRVDVPVLERDFQVNDLTSLRLACSQQEGKEQAYYVSDGCVVLACKSGQERVSRQVIGQAGTSTHVIDEVAHDGGKAYHQYSITLPLPTHPAFDIVDSWADGKGFEHKHLVRLLRTKLRGYVAPQVISQLENIKTSFAEDTSSTQTHAHSGLTRSVQREVRQQDGSELLPEFVVEVPVYDVPEYRDAQYVVSVIVDYDHDHKQFILTTVNDDLKQAREKAVAQVRTDLKTNDLPVYYGSI